MVPDTAHPVYPSHWSPLWCEISTLAYEKNTNCGPETFSVACCTHIVQTKLMLKNQISTKIDVTATGRSGDVHLVVLGYSVGVVDQ